MSIYQNQEKLVQTCCLENLLPLVTENPRLKICPKKDVKYNTFQIGVIDSTKFDLKTSASSKSLSKTL